MKYQTTETDKKKVKSLVSEAAVKTAAALIIYNIFTYIFSQLFILLFFFAANGYFPSDYSERASAAKLINGSTALLMLFQSAVTLCSALTLAASARAVYKIKISDIFSKTERPLAKALTYYPIAGAVNFSFTLLAVLISSFFMRFGVGLKTADFSLDVLDVKTSAAMFAYVCIVAPLCEEFVYRGLVIRLLAPFGEGAAVFVSALTFGMMHANIPQFICAFGVGLVLGYVTVKYRTVVLSVIIHSLNNFLPFLQSVINSWEDAPGAVIIIFNIFPIIITVLGLLAAALRYKKHFYRFERRTSAVSSAEKLGLIVFNPVMLMYFAVLIYETAASVVI